MFDKLIESEPAGADFKKRNGYFMVSTVVVGILFLTAVVISIYAQDFALGNQAFELDALLAPVEMAAAAPEPPAPRRVSQLPSTERNSLPTRTENVARTDESKYVPIGISTTPTNLVSRPNGDFRLGNVNSDPIGSDRTKDGVGTEPGTRVLASNIKPDVDDNSDVEPPPARPTAPVRPPAPRSLGVVNSMAITLPKPPYPATALAVNAQGAVSVQVTIDESGKVVAANAINGHPLLRDAAERAARGARFTPTLLSHVPVKVTGVIIYNFSR